MYKTGARLDKVKYADKVEITDLFDDKNKKGLGH